MALRVPRFLCSAPFGEIMGSPRDILWPVIAYRLTMPTKNERRSSSEGVNPFERVILQIIDAADGAELSESDLARETCLPENFVKVVLLRLRDQAFIDEHNTIIPLRRQAWKDDAENEFAKHENSQPEFATGIVYRELVTGKLLPYLQMVESEPQRWEKGDALDNLDQNAKKLHRMPNWQECPLPTPMDILQIRKAMFRRTLFSEKGVPPSPSQIIVQRQTDTYYLHCRMAIQKADAEYRIADPFGFGFSGILEQAFADTATAEVDPQLEDWLKRWYKSFARRQGQQEDESDNRFKSNFVCDDHSRAYYPRLIHRLDPGERPYRSITKLYSSLEWVLFYHCYHGSYESAIKVLEFLPQDEHVGHLIEIASKLNCTNVPAYVFRDVARGKIIDFKNGKAEMATVMAIALLQADVSGPENRLHILLRKYPDFFVRVHQLKKLRDNQEHGSFASGYGDEKLRDDDFVCDVVRTLIPSIQFGGEIEASEASARAFDQIVEARLGVISAFGYSAYNNLTESARQALVNAERAFIFRSEDDALGFLNACYAVIQNLFTNRSRDDFRNVAMPSADQLVATVDLRSRALGFGPLPQSCGLSQKRVRETLAGRPSTLGACLAEFLLKVEEPVLNRIHEQCPGFVCNIGEILQERKHGNESVIMDQATIEKFRKNAYQIIKTLQEN